MYSAILSVLSSTLVSRAAMYLSLFYGALTVGRLIFAPIIDKVGIFRCLIIFSCTGAVLYTAGIALWRSGMLILGISGLAFSIIYPLLVMLIGKFFDSSCAGSATGLILSIGTFFDIGFNAFFGSLTQNVGYAKAMTVMPIAAILVAVLLITLKASVKKSKEMFVVIQSYYNPKHNVERAIRMWQGGCNFNVRSTQRYYERVMSYMR